MIPECISMSPAFAAIWFNPALPLCFPVSSDLHHMWSETKYWMKVSDVPTFRPGHPSQGQQSQLQGPHRTNRLLCKQSPAHAVSMKWFLSFLAGNVDIDAWRSNLKRLHGFRLRRPRSEVASPKPAEASPMQRRGRALLQLWIMSDCKVLGYQLQLRRRMSSNATSPQGRKMYISIAAPRVLLRKMWQWCPILQRSKLWQQMNSFKDLHYFKFGFTPWM